MDIPAWPRTATWIGYEYAGLLGPEAAIYCRLPLPFDDLQLRSLAPRDDHVPLLAPPIPLLDVVFELSLDVMSLVALGAPLVALGDAAVDVVVVALLAALILLLLALLPWVTETTLLFPLGPVSAMFRAAWLACPILAMPEWTIPLDPTTVTIRLLLSMTRVLISDL